MARHSQSQSRDRPGCILHDVQSSNLFSSKKSSNLTFGGLPCSQAVMVFGIDHSLHYSSYLVV